jgi:hypothetical protein
MRIWDWFFDKGSFAEKLVTGMGTRRGRNSWRDAAFTQVQKDITRLYCEKDYLAGRSKAQKINLLKSISYSDYLTNTGAAGIIVFQKYSVIFGSASKPFQRRLLQRG